MTEIIIPGSTAGKEDNNNVQGAFDTLQYSILASGSSGNCTYVESMNSRIMIDAGLSGKRIEALFEQVDRKVSDLDAILVTHEHKDHIHGVGVLSRKYNIPIYANAKTWSAMENMLGKIAPENRQYIEPDTLVSIGDIDVLSYGVSHDAIQPQFYAFQKGKQNFAMLTDTGYVSDRLRSQLKNMSAYLIESNHEIELLRYGKYPWSVKQRILSDRGHLSNEDGALAMKDLIGNKTKDIYLGHLSRDNNTKQFAMASMEDILRYNNFAVNEDFLLHMTDPAEATPLKRL
ncbi:MBL fold metallo-hydrolase [Aerococcaceae bacterium DSM 111021]|nr:MBL fold metallo-hydrolase [Aerococcaceae bacterium DSM 111021]